MITIPTDGYNMNAKVIPIMNIVDSGACGTVSDGYCGHSTRLEDDLNIAFYYLIDLECVL
jgi:hypothetical protein